MMAAENIFILETGGWVRKTEKEQNGRRASSIKQKHFDLKRGGGVCKF
jgi:hypothetical protein